MSLPGALAALTCAALVFRTPPWFWVQEAGPGRSRAHSWWSKGHRGRSTAKALEHHGVPRNPFATAGVRKRCSVCVERMTHSFFNIIAGCLKLCQM